MTSDPRTRLPTRAGKTAPAKVELATVTPAAAQAPVQRLTIKKYGLIANLFRPFTLMAALLIAGYGLVMFGSSYWRSYQRHLEHIKAVHPDRTTVEITLRSTLPALSADAVHLVIRDADGRLRRVVTSRQAHDKFVTDTLRMVEAERARIKKAALDDIDALFAQSFKDRDAAIAAYADWFFEWKRSYIVLKETVSSAITRFFTLGEYERLTEAVQRDVRDYFMKHYQEQVLKPEQRDALITAGLEKTVRRAHKSYRQVVARGDARMARFLREHTTYLEELPTDGKLTRLSLDWDSQKWKAPTYLMEDKAFEGVAGLGSAAAGGTIGALALGPIMSRAMAQAFGGLSGQFAASMGTRLALAEGGAVAGSVVAPVGGQVVGVAIGVALGFAADYFINKANAKFSRGKFIAANEKALEATITSWNGKLKDSVGTAIDRWFDDTRAAILFSPAQPPAKHNARPVS